MLLVIAALLAASAARGDESTPKQAQAQPASTRSFTAVRVVPSDADAAPADMAPPGAPAAQAAPVVAPESKPHSSWYSLYDGNHFGLLIDAGVPTGAGISAMFRPWQLVRIEGGVNYNYLSFGLRGGVTFIPFEFAVTPTLHVEGGHMFDGDASRFVSDPGVKILLGHVPENYLSTSLGLEFGSQQRSVFFIRAGMSWIFTEASNVAASVNTSTGGSTLKSAANMPILLQIPTITVGYTLFIY
ncbi:MAG TPA: hypothetical protein VE620_12765 [Myxococcales bacterium]|jgi:hypothetical protein|nr:hypothetical protein [Myxococcales bacterium]